jgi:hypothetical protein
MDDTVDQIVRNLRESRVAAEREMHARTIADQRYMVVDSSQLPVAAAPDRQKSYEALMARVRGVGVSVENSKEPSQYKIVPGQYSGEKPK